VPVTLVCEEAHRYVPANASLGFEPCKRAIAKIAKEGRKYGASLCIVTQRPAEIDPTILSQCNTVFALRMSNDRDQAIVASAVSDTGSGLLEFLPSLGQREAIAFGDGMSLPVRITFDELPKHALPRSSTARFSEKWQKSLGDDGFLEQIVERWRLSAIGAVSDSAQNLSMMADAIALQGNPEQGEEAPLRRGTGQQPPHAASPNAAPRPHGLMRRDDPPLAPLPREAARASAHPSMMPDRGASAHDAVQASQSAPPVSLTTASSLRSLRDRLTRPSN
jgi:hypothetical protein